jgi:hypothetical protein
MEAAWELRPGTDETPGSNSHHNRFASGSIGSQGSGNSLSVPAREARMERDTVKTAETMSASEKNKGNGS